MMKAFRLYYSLILLALTSCSDCYRIYAPDSETYSDGSYKWISYYENNINERLKVIKYYKEGIKDTSQYFLVEKYYNDCQIAESTQYQNGVAHGTHKKWYESGQKLVEIHYKNGKQNGKYHSWFPDGNDLEIIIYEDDSVVRK